MTDNTKTVARLLSTAVFMFAFGFLLVPLYDVLCAVTGFNGKTAGQYVPEKTTEIDKDRWVTVQFITNNNAGMPFEFRPKQRSMRVHPGEINTTEFYIRNPVARTITAQAVPSVSPFHAAAYLHKTECFCFEQQQLVEGEALDMPLRFIVDSELPADVTTLTLSYTLFNISQEALAVAR